MEHVKIETNSSAVTPKLQSLALVKGDEETARIKHRKDKKLKDHKPEVNQVGEKLRDAEEESMKDRVAKINNTATKNESNSNGVLKEQYSHATQTFATAKI